MKQIIISLVVLVLAGCSSISEMRERGPHLEFKSKKEAQVLATCITMEWQKFRVVGGGATDVSMSLLPNGFSVFTPNQTEVADVHNIDNGSTVNFFVQTGLFDWRINQRVDGIKKCI
ncbi:hypothetical protein B7R74_02425 [Yersinia pseudotuberculosis]|uniref:Putative phage-related lipoprotein n=4 Tax=Yersinia TaxID=629 RepID=A0A0T9RL58_9GAMM|nr:hypothetical protein [Yersinia pseudotuberculosis]CNG03884.1 putative phage-related lipoprotein [Yersinia similis]MBO1610277.1 hypothetical protein [Yersinia pseudotuberculosis]MBO1621198.1 hypothetical protein [Yersinia pseudotuberculosis]PSH23513.1 hypothetical protein B7R74_02425 [Yersinia pseudotuberculosis]